MSFICILHFFIVLTSYSILVAVQVKPQLKGAMETAINNAIGSWLRHAPQRIKSSRASSDNLIEIDKDQQLDRESNPENLSEYGDDQNSNYREDNEKQGDFQYLEYGEDQNSNYGDDNEKQGDVQSSEYGDDQNSNYGEDYEKQGDVQSSECGDDQNSN